MRSLMHKLKLACMCQIHTPPSSLPVPSGKTIQIDLVGKLLWFVRIMLSPVHQHHPSLSPTVLNCLFSLHSVITCEYLRDLRKINAPRSVTRERLNMCMTFASLKKKQTECITLISKTWFTLACLFTLEVFWNHYRWNVY